ncbi:MAG: FAD-binding protein, partial [Burkholderiales bacterium]
MWGRRSFRICLGFKIYHEGAQSNTRALTTKDTKDTKETKEQQRLNRSIESFPAQISPAFCSLAVFAFLCVLRVLCGECFFSFVVNAFYLNQKPVQHIVDQFAQVIREARARKQPLRIRGGGTKDFYGEEPHGTVLDTKTYSGIVDYEPTELVITARAGTPIAEIEAAMRERGQMLGFEPPHFGDSSTLGGCIAA